MATTTPIDIRTHSYYYYILIATTTPIDIRALIATTASIDIRTYSYYRPHRYTYS